MPIRWQQSGAGEQADRLIRPIVDLVNQLERSVAALDLDQIAVDIAALQVAVALLAITVVGVSFSVGPARGVNASVDFGADSDYATAVVTGQSWVAATSRIAAQVAGSTADHDPEDALLEQLQISVSDLVPGVGFTVQAHAPEGTFGLYNVHCVGL